MVSYSVVRFDIIVIILPHTTTPPELSSFPPKLSHQAHNSQRAHHNPVKTPASNNPPLDVWYSTYQPQWAGPEPEPEPAPSQP